VADDAPTKRASGLAPIIGAITAGKREHDKIIKTVLSAGFAGAMCLYLLHAWNQDRAADREQRKEQHKEMVNLMREQHQEDIVERRIMACVNQQMTTTVRAAIWRERPQPLEACAKREP
jgi:uncharacterized membrane-anchored protein